jgi:hypothetical protein
VSSISRIKNSELSLIYSRNLFSATVWTFHNPKQRFLCKKRPPCHQGRIQALLSVPQKAMQKNYKFHSYRVVRSARCIIQPIFLPWLTNLFNIGIYIPPSTGKDTHISLGNTRLYLESLDNETREVCNRDSDHCFFFDSLLTKVFYQTYERLSRTKKADKTANESAPVAASA